MQPPHVQAQSQAMVNRVPKVSSPPSTAFKAARPTVSSPATHAAIHTAKKSAATTQPGSHGHGSTYQREKVSGLTAVSNSPSPLPNSTGANCTRKRPPDDLDSDPLPTHST